MKYLFGKWNMAENNICAGHFFYSSPENILLNAVIDPLRKDVHESICEINLLFQEMDTLFMDCFVCSDRYYGFPK